LQWLIGLSVVWLTIAAIGLVAIWPNLGSWREAASFIAFFPPFYVLGEVVSGWLFSPSHGAAISSKQFSWARILVALPVGVAWLGLSWYFLSVMLK